MKFSIGLVEAADMIRHNKMRTALTMFGMNVGVAAIIAATLSTKILKTDRTLAVSGIGFLEPPTGNPIFSGRP